MKRFLIIADDFTGANDTGVQFTKRGIHTQVIFSGDIKNCCEQAIVIDTETRGMKNSEAYKRVRRFSKTALAETFTCVYKKVDSTLRGNIPDEVKALDEVYKPELIIFAPAYPTNGRITLGGVQYMKGMPVSKTEVGRDPKKPVTEDNITNLLKNGLSEEVVHISLENIRNENVDLTKERIFTFDAVDDEDLAKIVEVVNKQNKKTLWIGSAGLADAIMQVDIPFRPVLSIVGSISEVSSRQVRFVEKQGAKIIKVNISEILKDNNISSVIEEAVKSLNEGKDTVLVSSYTREDYEECIKSGSKLGMTKEKISIFTQETLGKTAEEILRKVQVAGLFLTGGDTAIEVIKKIQANGSKILQELTVGIPLMKIRGGSFDGLHVVTKAGAFGEANALDYCMRKLKEVF